MSNVPYSSLNTPGTPNRQLPEQEADIAYAPGYNAPPSPGLDQPFDPYNLPAGATQPRFLGTTGADIRSSYASNNTYGTANEWRSSNADYDSVRGLNFPGGGSTPSLAALAAGGTG
jgi:hypothetical protein